MEANVTPNVVAKHSQYMKTFVENFKLGWGKQPS